MINTNNSRPISAKISNSHNSINLLQSPKITSTKFRRDIIIDSNINHNKLFSLNDINDKITNQKGTTLPIQYERKSEEELKELFTIKEYKSKNDKENKQNKILKKEYLSFDERKNLNNPIKNNLNDLSINNLTIEEKNIKRPQTAITLRKKSNNSSNDKLKNKNNKVKKQIKYKPIHTENDYYLPKGYINYYKYVTNPEYYKEKVNNKINSITPNYKFINYKDIKVKSSESDIFMQKDIKNSREINYNSFRESITNNNYYHESDIFNRKKDLNDFEKNKIGEKFLFNSELAKNKISNIAESNSNWEIKKSILIKSKNLPSTKYNIISPRLKNNIPIQKDITKYNKTKGIDEFINLTRVTSCNPNLDYVKKIKENPFAFRKIREVCNDYYESYNSGKSILRKPF